MYPTLEIPGMAARWICRRICGARGGVTGIDFSNRSGGGGGGVSGVYLLLSDSVHLYVFQGYREI